MPKLVWERQCSETEGLEANVVDSGRGNSSPSVAALLLKAPDQVKDNNVGDGENDEEVPMQTTVSCDDTNITETVSLSGGYQEKIPVFVSRPENDTVNEKDNVSSSGTEVVNDVVVGESGTPLQHTKVSEDIDDEDAICRRTRARYSLASFTLDELETFLQETDDDEDFQNVDDEEEYRKFLAAVLHGDNDHMAEQGTENIYDEDEDNDADFELEIEEALESDVDENLRLHAQVLNYEGGGRRPETRQNKRLKTSGRLKKRSSAHVNVPLRPLLPNVPALPFATVHNKQMMLGSAPNSPLPSAFNGIVNGFTPHQIGQLHCLIFEHVQLLIQVYSLSVFESSKENIATQVKGLISEMIQNRDQVLTWRREPYPSFCFFPPYVRPSLPHKLTQNTFQSLVHDSERDCCVENNVTVPSDPCNIRHQYVPGCKDDGLQANEGPIWMPFINGHVMSILDVAPLNIVKNYMEEVSCAVKDYKRRHVGDNCDTRFEKEPLFPYETLISSADEVPGSSKALHRVPSSGTGQGSKKTLAGILVERTKKQSVAPVPKQIARLAQSFFHLFNPALFPHKPPSVSIASRVLFTEAEDMLLASGLMEFNTDWKAIQQHFLPCKSKHQIFVRQKNRTCSRAPENPIKAVRRFKNSPLTAEETARIREGLKIFKLDWMSVWKFVVPYRDPSLLPRQWRIATGTQKSYKVDEHKKEKRRLYELRRREGKPANLVRAKSSSEKEDCSAGEEINSGNDCMDNDNEAYVHEAFLADWRPDTSSASLELPTSTCEVEPIPNFLPPEGCHTKEQTNSSGPGDLQIDQQFSASLKNSQPLASSHCSRANIASVNQLNNPFSDMLLKSSRSQPLLPLPQTHTNSSARLVKLSPDLPPVNLPPSVRVMSQSAFKNYQGRTSNIVSSSQSCFAGPSTPNSVPKLLNVSKSATTGPMKAGHNNIIPFQSCISHSHPEEPIRRNKVTAEDQDGSDLHMHPLLFQTPDDSHLPYYPLNCGTSASSSFNYFPRNQPLLNLSLLHNPKQANYTLNQSGRYSKSVEKISPSFGIDFHPLLQRRDDVNSNLVAAPAAAEPCLPAELSGSQHTQSGETYDTERTNNCSVSTLAILSSPSRKTTELDLDIHLSCTSRKQVSGESRDTIKQSMIRRPPTSDDSGIIRSQNSANPSKHLNGSSPEAIPPGISKNGDSGAHAANQSNQESGDHPEIVMEQEELSDSEEEITEDVEFECEEMTDSEGEEESEIEHMYSMGEEPPILVANKAMGGENNNQQHELRPYCETEHDANISSEGSRSKSIIEDQEKDNLNNSSC